MQGQLPPSLVANTVAYSEKVINKSAGRCWGGISSEAHTVKRHVSLENIVKFWFMRILIPLWRYWRRVFCDKYDVSYKTNRKNEGMKNISLKSKCMKTYTNVNVYKRIPIYLGTFFCCTPIFNIFWLKYYRNSLVLNKQKLLYWVLTLDQARESTLCSKSQLFCVCVNVVRVFNSRTFKRKVIECS